MKTLFVNLIVIIFLLCNNIYVNATHYNDALIYLHPLPNSQYHPALTTIIVKLDTSYLDDITDLSSFISATGKQGEYKGETFFSSDNRTIIFKPENNFNWGDTISVKVETSQMITSDFSFEFSTTPDWADDVTMHGKFTLEKSDLKQKAEIITSTSGIKEINGLAVPSDFPDITTTVYGETAPGLIFFADHQEHMIIHDNEGNIYYYFKLEGEQLGNVTVQPNNQLTVGVYGKRLYGMYLVFDSTFTLIDTIVGSNGYFIDSHEMQFIGNNHRLSVNEYWFYMNIAPPDSTPEYTKIHSENIHENDSLGNVIFVWRDIDYTDYPVEVKEIHMNSLDIDYDGNIIVSTRNNNEVFKINRETGEYIWRLGGENNMFDFVNDSCMFMQQHDFRPLKGQPNHYLLFDNQGGWECTGYSTSTRVLEYLIDTNNWTAEVVWSYFNPDYQAIVMGSAQRFENGNTFIDLPEGGTHVFEINAVGETQFEMHCNPSRNYRCRRYEWYGKMTKPSLYYENRDNEIILYFCQFGDSTIQYYNIYHGTDENNLTHFDTTSNTHYIAFFEDFGMNYFAVTSIDSMGNESDFSRIGSQFLAITESMTNKVKNGTFNSFLDWRIDAVEGADYKYSTIGSQLKVELLNTGPYLGDIALIQEPFILIKGKNYLLEFDSWADAARVIEANLINADIPFTNYSNNGESQLTKEKQHFAYTFTMEENSDPHAVLQFEIGQYTGLVYFDNISLKCLEEGVNPQFETYFKVNFQQTSETKQYYYFIDTGQVYGSDYYFYGWTEENLNAETRESATDFRYKGFNYLKKGSQEFTWEVEVPETQYAVKIGMGDSDSTNQINQIYIEGNLIEDEDGEDNFDEIVFSDFDVTDGKLTIAPGPDAVNAKIAYINIYHNMKFLGVEDYPEIQNADLNVFPNPVKNVLNVDFYNTNNQHINIALFDMLGKKIMDMNSGRYNIGEYSLQFDISQLTGSIYFIIVQYENQTITKKIIMKQ